MQAKENLESSLESYSSLQHTSFRTTTEHHADLERHRFRAARLGQASGAARNGAKLVDTLACRDAHCSSGCAAGATTTSDADAVD